MGLRGLNGFIKSKPRCFKTVNIVEELENYKRASGRRPVIIINLWTLSHHFKLDGRDQAFGCRYNQIQETFDRFLSRIRQTGAEMIFMFKKMQCYEADFPETIRQEFNAWCEVQEVIDTTMNAEDCVAKFNKMSKFIFPFQDPVLMVLAQTARKYASFFAKDKGNCTPTSYHVKLANNQNAMALMGTDTYYVFYEGSWKFWIDMDLDMEAMTITEYNKERILEELQINIENAPLFVALAGGLYSNALNVKKILWHFQFWTKRVFENVSQFIKLQRLTTSDESIVRVIRIIFGRDDETIRADFSRTIQLMSLTENNNTSRTRKQRSNKIFTLDRIDRNSLTECASVNLVALESKISYNPKQDRDIIENAGNDHFSYANLILGEEPIFISPMFLKEIDFEPFTILATTMIRKTAGILLKNSDDLEPITFIIMQEGRNPVCDFQAESIFPSDDDFSVTALVEMVFGETSGFRALKMLLWISGLEITPESVDDIKNESLANFIILALLVKHFSMKKLEVAAIMQTIVDVNNRSVPNEIEYPEHINQKALRASSLYTKVYFVLHSCLGSVGIKQYQDSYKFDNAHFQHVYAAKKLQTTKNFKSDDAMEIFECLKAIDA